MKKIFTLSIVAFALALSFPFSASAGSGHNMTGFAWSSNVGWISFNSTNDHDSATAGVQQSATDYGVNLDFSTGYLTGYAWSSNIGWIQFGGLSGFPAGSGTTADNARLVGSGITGWAKALSADGNGWDGWISLSGTGYGITKSDDDLAGYAWGSSVVGWLRFDHSGAGNVIVSGDAPSVAFDAQIGGTSINGSTSVQNGSTVSLVSTLANLPSATTCSVRKTSFGGVALSPSPSASSTATWTVMTAALTGPTDYEYTLTCDNNQGFNVTSDVSFSVEEQQPEFSIGGDESIGVTFVRSGSTDSEAKTITVLPTNFSGNVNISFGGLSPAMHASTTILYSIDGQTFSATPASKTIPSNGATTFRIRLSEPVQDICTAPGVPSGCKTYEITINGTDASGLGAPARTKVYTINQTAVDGSFQEI